MKKKRKTVQFFSLTFYKVTEQHGHVIWLFAGLAPSPLKAKPAPVYGDLV